MEDRRTLHIQLLGSQLVIAAEALAKEVKVRADQRREEIECALQDLPEVHIALQQVVTVLVQAMDGNVAECLEYLSELVENGIEGPLEKQLREYDEDAPWHHPGREDRVGWFNTKPVF